MIQSTISSISSISSMSSKRMVKASHAFAHQRDHQTWARHLWVLPMLLSLIFVAVVVAWLQRADTLDREERRQIMIADALTLEAQLRGQLDFESSRLEEIGKSLQAGVIKAEQFEKNAEINAGFGRIWQAVTWLDQDNRVLAHVASASADPSALLPTTATAESVRGISSHLVASIAGARGTISGSLVARYSPTALLKRGVPWWLARKYHVRLTDSLDQELAASEDLLPQKTGSTLGFPRISYALSFDPPIRDAALELTEHAAFVPWYRGLPPVLMTGFLALVLIATWMLRRQMQGVLRAESAWRTEAAWRSAMEDSVVVGLRARDFEGRLVYVNRTFAEMVGWPQEMLIGMMTPMPYWLPDQIEETMQRHLRNMAGDAPREGYEARWQHRDGHHLDVMVFETPLVDASGAQIGWMGSILEITERKLMEERDRKQADTLAHHARLTMLGEIASTLAHELNQPLTAIASYNAGVINSLKRDGFTDADVHDALQRLGEQAAQAGRIVQRIREFLTRREPERESCEIHQVVVNAITLFRRELDRHQVVIKLNNLNEAVRVTADPVLIEQVIINLLRNATDALMMTADRQIEVTIHSAGERFLRIDVTDNGPGLAGRTIKQLCTAFYSTKSEGMGMGLAICRSIIEAHEGAFDACEAPSNFAKSGAQFSLSLPLVQSTRAPARLDQALHQAAE
jgi:two-component system, LuxR family, sensor histidine kinase DctS